MKRIFYAFIAFIIITLFIKLCPAISLLDRSLIVYVQAITKNIPVIIPMLPDCILYSFMIAVPILFGTFYFLFKKKYMQSIFLCSVPIVTFMLNCIIKPIVHRARPPYELQPVIHPESFSYVSSHSLVTLCLWGLVVYYFHKYCKSKKFNVIITITSVLWILFVGFSRIWLGVHYPSDVLAAYILGYFLLQVYIKSEARL